MAVSVTETEKQENASKTRTARYLSVVKETG